VTPIIRSTLRFFSVALLALFAVSCSREADAPAEPDRPAPPESAAAEPTATRPSGSTYRASGNEPFWAVERDGEAIAFRPLDGQEQIFSHAQRTETQEGFTLTATLDGRMLALDASTALCSDTMSGMAYPDRVRLRVDDRVFDGCGGSPRDLLLGPGFAVVSLDGAPIDAPLPTLQFNEERAAGFGGCNRWNAGYALTGEGLTFEQAASTMMACDAAAMTRERAFLDALGRVTRHDFSESGELILLAGDAPVIVARRQAAEG